jgi:type IV pilus assembly protein PilC
MAEYRYTAMSLQGKKTSGKMEAENKEDLKRLLRGQKLTLLKEKKVTDKQGKGGILNRVTPKDIAVFTRQLSTMLEGGVGLLRSFTVLEKQCEKPKLKVVVGEIIQDISSGKSISYALSKHPQYFDSLYVSMVKAGEASGALDTILNRIAESQEKAEEIKGKIRTAMIYPSIVLVLSFTIVFLLMSFVIPNFVVLFEDTGVPMPSLTVFVIGISKWFNKNWYWILLGVGILAFIGYKYQKTPKGKRNSHRLILRLPLFGKIFKKASVARFSRTLETLLDSGVPILSAFDIVADTVGNILMGESIREVKDKIKSGHTIAKPLEETGSFPPMVVNMIDVGEESGELVKMLSKLADFNERELEETIRDSLAAFEPMMILIMALTVGMIVVAMYLPVFSLSDTIV